MYTKLEKKIIVIAGGSGLIGSAFVKAVAHSGGFPVIADRNVQTAKLLRESLGKVGLKAQCVELDITSQDSWTQCFAEIKSTLGKVDAVVNCAYPKGKGYGKDFEKVSYDEFNDSVDLHLGGYFLSMQQSGIFFRSQGFGNIINIASIYGIIPPRFQVYAGTMMTTPVQYAAIKSGIVHLTKYVARYYKNKNIRCNCISPGGILDNQPEIFIQSYKSFCASKGMLVADDLTGALLFLLSDMSEFMTGQNLVVDDGFSL